MDNEANYSNESNKKNTSKSYYDLYPSFQQRSNSFIGINIPDKSEQYNYLGN